MDLQYFPSGHLFISPLDDCHDVVSAMLATDYGEDFCIAVDFSPEFAARLMEAGFLVMSVKLTEEDEEADPEAEKFPIDYILLPKLHLERSVLLFENLHVKKSIRRLLGRYELRVDAEFDRIVNRCVEKHGGDWLTPPLVECIKKIRENWLREELPAWNVRPVSFALYRDGKLAAGEFGVVCGKVYTSYSGFYDEDNAGTAQIILAVRYLQEQGFSFVDLGMPLDYKTDLGAINVDPWQFVRMYREAYIP